MGTIADKLSMLYNTKNDIKNMIESKGVVVGDTPFSEYPSLITDIHNGLWIVSPESVLSSEEQLQLYYKMVPDSDQVGVVWELFDIEDNTYKTDLGWVNIDQNGLISFQRYDAAPKYKYVKVKATTKLKSRFFDEVEIKIEGMRYPKMSMINGDKQIFNGTHSFDMTHYGDFNETNITVEWRLDGVDETIAEIINPTDKTCIISVKETPMEGQLCTLYAKVFANGIELYETEIFLRILENEVLCTNTTNQPLTEYLFSKGVGNNSVVYKNDITSVTNIDDLPKILVHFNEFEYFNVATVIKQWMMSSKLVSISFPSNFKIPDQIISSSSNLIRVDLNGAQLLNPSTFSTFATCTKLRLIYTGGLNNFGRYLVNKSPSVKYIEINDKITSLEGTNFIALNNVDIIIKNNPNFHIDMNDETMGYSLMTKSGQLIWYGGYVPEDYNSLSPSAFENSDIEEITLNSNVKDLPNNLFYSCTKLKNVLLPEGLISIGSSAFLNCNSLPTINLPSTLTSMDGNAFSGCFKLNNIVIPEGVTVLNDALFNGCSSLSNLTLHDKITTIGNSVFQGCTSFTSIDLPKSITSIGASAFRNCNKLEAIEIPPNVKTIGDNAFENCYNLQTIISKNEIAPSGLGDNTFLYTGRDVVDKALFVPTEAVGYGGDKDVAGISFVPDDPSVKMMASNGIEIGTNDFSLEFYVQLVTKEGSGSIFTPSVKQRDKNGVNMSKGQTVFWIYVPTTIVTERLIPNIPIGYNHLVLTREGKNIKIYKDGVFITELIQENLEDYGTFIYEIANSPDFRLGRMFNYALNSEEITKLWNNGEPVEYVLDEKYRGDVNENVINVNNLYVTYGTKTVTDEGVVVTATDERVCQFFVPITNPKVGEVAEIELTYKSDKDLTFEAYYWSTTPNRVSATDEFTTVKFVITNKVSGDWRVYVGGNNQAVFKDIKVKYRRVTAEYLPQNIIRDKSKWIDSSGQGNDLISYKPEMMGLTWLRESDQYWALFIGTFKNYVLGNRNYNSNSSEATTSSFYHSRVFNYALSDTEVANLYNNGNPSEYVVDEGYKGIDFTKTKTSTSTTQSIDVANYPTVIGNYYSITIKVNIIEFIASNTLLYCGQMNYDGSGVLWYTTSLKPVIGMNEFKLIVKATTNKPRWHAQFYANGPSTRPVLDNFSMTVTEIGCLAEYTPQNININTLEWSDSSGQNNNLLPSKPEDMTLIYQQPYSTMYSL